MAGVRRRFTLDLAHTKCVVEAPGDPERRVVLLDAAFEPPGAWEGLPAALQDSLRAAGLEGALTRHEVTITYDQLSAEAVLRRLLPEGVAPPTAFETVGHIAHFNLRPELEVYGAVIGAVVLDKNPGLRTVVSKVGEITSEFRVFDMRVLAGERTTVAEVVQHGLRFRLDLARVFWNSRLETEHARLPERHFRPGETVLDVFAGVGPFAVPAARAGCTVFANDLNPDSVHWLRENAALNRVASKVHAFCMDGRAFIDLLSGRSGAASPAAQNGAAVGDGNGAAVKGTAGGDAADADGRPVAVLPDGWVRRPGGVRWHHAVMNLPGSAVSFLSAFRGACRCSDAWPPGATMPLIHVYTFQKRETHADVLRRVEAALGGELGSEAEVREVRHVAPGKYHVCVSFRLPRAVATEAAPADGCGASEPIAAAEPVCVPDHRNAVDRSLQGAPGKRPRCE